MINKINTDNKAIYSVAKCAWESVVSQFTTTGVTDWTTVDFKLLNDLSIIDFIRFTQSNQYEEYVVYCVR